MSLFDIILIVFRKAAELGDGQIHAGGNEDMQRLLTLETLHRDGALAVVLVQWPEGIGVVLVQVHLQVAAVAVLITLWRCVDGHDLVLTQHAGRLDLRIDVRTTTRMGEQVHRAAAEDEDFERAWRIAIQ